MAAAWGSLTEITMTDADTLPAAEYTQSAGVDLGATPYHGISITVEITWATGGSAGEYADVFMAKGIESTSANLAGLASGSDATYTAGRTQDMTYLGRVENPTDTTKEVKNFWVPDPTRYFALVVYNQVPGEAFTAFEANYVTRLLA